MTTTLADLRELTRTLSAFAAFQGHFVSTFAAFNSLSRKIFSLLRRTNSSESWRVAQPLRRSCLSGWPLLRGYRTGGDFGFFFQMSASAVKRHRGQDSEPLNPKGSAPRKSQASPPGLTYSSGIIRSR